MNINEVINQIKNQVKATVMTVPVCRMEKQLDHLCEIEVRRLIDNYVHDQNVRHENELEN